MTGKGKCSYSVEWPDERHSTGGAERYLEAEFDEVQPLVFGQGEVSLYI